MSCGGQPVWRTKSCAREEKRLLTMRPTIAEHSKRPQAPTSTSTWVRSTNGIPIRAAHTGQQQQQLQLLTSPERGNGYGGEGRWRGPSSADKESSGPTYPPTTRGRRQACESWALGLLLQPKGGTVTNTMKDWLVLSASPVGQSLRCIMGGTGEEGGVSMAGSPRSRPECGPWSLNRGESLGAGQKPSPLNSLSPQRHK